MRRFLLNMAIFAALIAVCDAAIGLALSHLARTAPYGQTRRLNDISYNVTDSVIVLGSSLARYNYNPATLEDSLGMSCYNCGEERNGIVLMLGRFSLITSRYTPSLIIYDVECDYDLRRDNLRQYLPPLRYYYGRPCVDTLFAAVSAAEPLLMLSGCYHYGYDVAQLVGDHIRPNHLHYKGYNPKPWSMRRPPEPTAEEPFEHSPAKLALLDRLMCCCDSLGIPLVLTISPKYGATSDSVFTPLTRMAASRGVPVINHFCDTVYNTRAELYMDPIHLNSRGSGLYSSQIASEIKALTGLPERAQ